MFEKNLVTAVGEMLELSKRVDPLPAFRAGTAGEAAIQHVLVWRGVHGENKLAAVREIKDDRLVAAGMAARVDQNNGAVHKEVAVFISFHVYVFSVNDCLFLIAVSKLADHCCYQ